MKKFIKFSVVLILTLTLFIAVLPFKAYAAPVVTRYGREQLTTNQKYLYDAFVQGCANAQESIFIDTSSNKVNTDDIETAFMIFYSDYPEYFWITGGWNAAIKNNFVTIYPEYSMTGSALNSAKSKFNAKVSELTSGVSGSDYDKAKNLHDKVVNLVKYVTTPNDQNAYGALVEGKAICNGYARAYQHLMNQVGIPTWYIRGTSVNPVTGETIGHAWNIAKLNGSWYYTDVTWDDQDTETFYEFFNITSAKLALTHTADSLYKQYLPNTGSSNDVNYYVKENRYFSSYNRQQLINLLQKDNRKSQIYIDGDVNQFLNAVQSDLLNIVDIIGPTDTVQCTFHVSGLQKAIILELITISNGHSHSPAKTVAQVGASCITNGTKQHYVCSCGLKFTDAGCTSPITSEDVLIIPPTSHSISGYKNDTNNHWKVCTKCGSEIIDTRGSHKDSNKDNKCDVCSYKLPVKDSEGNVNISGNTETKPTTQETKPQKQPSTPSSEPTENPNQSTESTNEIITNNPTEPNNDGHYTDQNQSATNNEEGNGSISPVLLIILITIGGGAAITIIMFANKQR